MTQRRKKPSGKQWNELPADLRSNVLMAIDSAKGESPNDIFDRFDLAGRGLNQRTFQRMVHQRRKRVDPVPEDLSADVPDWGELDEMMRRAIADNVQAGNVKIYEAATVIRQCHDRQRLKIEQAADGRAQSKFDAWQTEYAEEQRQRIKEGERQLKDAGFDDETLDKIRSVYGLGDLDHG